MVITIDGLAVNGKTTLAKKISEKINFKNFSAGAVYRCIALEIINKNLSFKEKDKILEEIKNIKIDFQNGKTYLNGIDVSKTMRAEEVSLKANECGAIPEIKDFVRTIQKRFIEENDTVMEGRDIGTRIAPHADIKFYIYSDFETRVQRSHKATGVDIEEVRENLKTIDNRDINGGSFVKPTGAIEIDTSNKTLDEVYEIMLEEIRKVKSI